MMAETEAAAAAAAGYFIDGHSRHHGRQIVSQRIELKIYFKTNEIFC